MIFIAGYGAAGGAPGGLTVLASASPSDRYTVPLTELSYLALHPGGRYLYGVSGLQQGHVHAWRIEDGGRRLVALGAPVESGGFEPCHLVVDQAGRHLLVANYGGTRSGSVAVFTIEGDGSLRQAGVVTRRTRPGPDRERQAESHIHQVVPVAQDRVLVVDLGADEVVDYRLADGRLSDPVVSAAPAGSGPRHLVRLDGGQVLVSAELDSTLLRARQVGRRLVDWQASPASGVARPSGRRNYPSDLVAAADPASVYLANRGSDSIALLSTAGDVQAEMRCGAWPRQLALSGHRLYVASTNADQVGVFDALKLVPAGPPIAVGRPMCVVVTPGSG